MNKIMEDGGAYAYVSHTPSPPLLWYMVKTCKYDLQSESFLSRYGMAYFEVLTG